MKRKICVIGGGRWGGNHIRTLYEMGNLAGIVEPDTKRLHQLMEQYPVRGFEQVDSAIEQGFDGYILATPAETHYPIGKMLLEKGLNTLIEKPMALSASEARELVKLAGKNRVGLMVGHLLLFHPAIKKIKEIIDGGSIGRLYYLYSTRLKLGTVRTEEDVFWSFAPHDVAVLNYFIGHPPLEIEAKGAGFLQDKISDVAMALLEYPDNVHAHIFVSWLHPFKEQRLVVVGSRGMLSFDDASEGKSINYYQKRIDWREGKPVALGQPDEVIDYERRAPLAEELRYFVENLDRGFALSSGENGYDVLRVLEEVQQQLKVKGTGLRQ